MRVGGESMLYAIRTIAHLDFLNNIGAFVWRRDIVRSRNRTSTQCQWLHSTRRSAPDLDFRRLQSQSGRPRQIRHTCRPNAHFGSAHAFSSMTNPSLGIMNMRFPWNTLYMEFAEIHARAGRLFPFVSQFHDFFYNFGLRC